MSPLTKNQSRRSHFFSSIARLAQAMTTTKRTHTRTHVYVHCENSSPTSCTIRLSLSRRNNNTHSDIGCVVELRRHPSMNRTIAVPTLILLSLLRLFPLIIFSSAVCAVHKSTFEFHQRLYELMFMNSFFAERIVQTESRPFRSMIQIVCRSKGNYCFVSITR